MPKKASRKVPAFHAHGCLKCGRRYMDNCKTPFDNGICVSPCTNGMEAPTWDKGRFPAYCCRSHSKRVTDIDVLNRYALGGPGPWFQCRVCKRTHPFDPTGAIA